MPFFSIIVPIYNLVNEVPATLKSILSQSFEDYEVILVDDGSVDGSEDLVESFASDKVKVIHQTNQGVVVARQKGFAASQGQWILFVDGDDALLAGALCALTRCIQFSSSDLIQFGYKAIDSKGVSKRVMPFRNGIATTQDILSQMKKSPLEVLGMCIGNKCYKRNVVRRAFSDVGDVHITRCEDGLFALAAFFCSQKISFLQECLYEYNYRPFSASHSANPLIVSDCEGFVCRADELSRKSLVSTDVACKKIFDSLSREAIGRVFMECLRGPWNIGEFQKICNRAVRARFFREEHSEWNPIMHFVMKELIKHPNAFWRLRKLVLRLVELKLRHT